MYIILSPTEQWRGRKSPPNVTMNDREARPREMMQVEVAFGFWY